MRVIFLPIIFTIIIDILAWLLIQLSIAKLSLKISSKFLKEFKLFKVLKFEEEPSIYQTIFKIRYWKDKLPEGSKIVNAKTSKKQLDNSKQEYLNDFLIEINRGELAHWLQIIPAPLFFLFNLEWVGWLMIVYALAFNLPFIMIQRFNRARLIRVLDLKVNKL
jgi:glycosyl-4,4'-diaponeurosporenoate acyltransferase